MQTSLSLFTPGTPRRSCRGAGGTKAPAAAYAAQSSGTPACPRSEQKVKPVYKRGCRQTSVYLRVFYGSETGSFGGSLNLICPLYSTLLNSSFPTPQSGHTQSSGISSHAVPGSIPLSVSPTSGSYSYPQTSHTYLSMVYLLVITGVQYPPVQEFAPGRLCSLPGGRHYLRRIIQYPPSNEKIFLQLLDFSKTFDKM